MVRQVPFSVGEVYHVFNRGAHKREVFSNAEDYRRFLLLLHLCNSTNRLNMRDLLATYKGRSFAEVFEEERVDHSLADVYAYCLMPNHFHLVLREKEEKGISTFLKKVLTGYSMYFNTKYDHSGVLFEGRFKSSHIDNDSYFRYIFSYVHLNPLTLFDRRWKESGLKDIEGARRYMYTYHHSSFGDYAGPASRPESRILALNTAPEFLFKQNDLEELLCNFTKDRPLQTRPLEILGTKD